MERCFPGTRPVRFRGTSSGTRGFIRRHYTDLTRCVRGGYEVVGSQLGIEYGISTINEEERRVELKGVVPSYDYSILYSFQLQVGQTPGLYLLLDTRS